MARTRETDYLQNFRFHARVVDGPDFLAFESEGQGEAGFQSITLPEETFEVAEYREGNYKYTKKFPGPPTFSDVTLMQGIVNRNTTFYNWGLAGRGGSDYRCDVEIVQFHGDDVQDGVAGKITSPGSRITKLHEAFAMRHKDGTDLDATSGEVSIQELDLSLEFYEVIVVSSP